MSWRGNPFKQNSILREIDFKKLAKIDRSMPVGTRQVLNFFRDSSKLKLEFLAVNAKLPPMAYVYPTKYVHIKSTTVYAPRRNWDFPQPPTRRLVCPLPPVSGGRGTLAGEKGVGRVPIPTRGVHCGTLYMYVLCGLSVFLQSHVD